MSDPRFEQFFGFLKKAGEDIRTEAQRLLEDIKDPEKQQRVKESLREVSTWAKHTAEDVADMVEKTVRSRAEGGALSVAELVEKTVRKAEGALTDAAKRVGVKVPGSSPTRRGWAPEPHAASPVVVRAEPVSQSPAAEKTGRRRSAPKKSTGVGTASKRPKAKPTRKKR